MKPSSSSQPPIVIRGAREHNLKGIDLEIPRNALVVITGLSGSGKSSLAFDTLYAEGQRRYVESLSAYARQFLEQLQKPNVERIDGLSPAIAIEQRTAGGNPRSIVATQTEVYDYLRLLFARIGIPHCYRCGRLIQRQSVQEILEQVLRMPAGQPILVLAPLVRGRKGQYQELFRQVQKEGFVRARVDGKLRELDKPITLDKKRAHTVEVVVDRLQVDPKVKQRLADSLETALKAGKGMVVIQPVTGQRPVVRHPSAEAAGREGSADLLFSEQHACAACGISMAEMEPRLFSFNSPYGACPACHGLGTKLEVDRDLVIPDPSKSIAEGALEPWRRGGRGYILYHRALVREFADQAGFSLSTPFRKLPESTRHAILYGSKSVEIWGRPFEGVIPNLERLFQESESDFVKEEISKYMSMLPCPGCRGARLKPEAEAVRVRDRSIIEITRMTVEEGLRFFGEMKLSAREAAIAQPILKEIRARLQFMIDVGLGYLTLDRPSSTLSGGEAQRIRLATQIGAGLVGVLYILDEPSIGLHPRDTRRLLDTLKALRDLGNTVIVVEHDEGTIRAADFIVDLGPGAGKQGGEVVAAGPLEEILRSPRSLTGMYLRGERSIPLPAARRPWRERPYLEIVGAREHNLKKIKVRIPIGTFTCVTGVSGSGKSTLVDEILYRALAQRLYRSKLKPGAHDRITGVEQIDKVIVVDQDPIGRTPRSNPATYTGVFSDIRALFSKMPEARARGYRPGRFSFNVKGGRCEACQGEGVIKVEMHFLPPVYVTCEICRGNRFNEQTLDVLYKGCSIADVLRMSVDEALELFRPIPRVRSRLQTLQEVGLGYIEVGQPATTLSGGEAQRVKLATELSHRATGKTLYILDEPTTGLHLADIEKLLKVLHALVDQGNTVLVIEHHLDVIKTADLLIDLGPGGGEEGGHLVAAGTPEEVAKEKRSFTGQFLSKIV
ncbi:MAG: excinuclease ABC subunit UvrA [Candidatus Omnitrophica bacterium]|nr:excinuclease ABC subunit UvrA [Candidatus Omnitrophota bacterium]